jgi:hypothetical protein
MEWAVRLTYGAFGSLILHTFFELYLDLASHRITIHGRYSDFPCLNIFLSIIFLSGVLGEGLTYVMLSQQDGGANHDNAYNNGGGGSSSNAAAAYQNNDDYTNAYNNNNYNNNYNNNNNNYNNQDSSLQLSSMLSDHDLYMWVSLVSPHLFLLLFLLSSWGRSCCVRGAGLDNIANTMFAIGTLLFLFAAYWTFAMDDVRGRTAEEESFVAKWTGVFIWDVAAFLYAGRDILKYTAYRSTSSRYRQRLYEEEEEDSGSYTSGTYA